MGRLLKIWMATFLIGFFGFILISPINAQQFLAQKTENNTVTKNLQQLEQKIATFETISGGKLGVSAAHLESGEQVNLHGDERFPMASTYKIPIAIQLMQKVSQGEIQLNQQIEIEPRDLRHNSKIAESFKPPKQSLSIKDLMDTMMITSDNTASDILIEKAGGAKAVTAFLHQHNLKNMRVDRTEAEMLAETLNISLPPKEKWTGKMFKEYLDSGKAQNQELIRRRNVDNLKDTATPKAMTSLLTQLDRKKLLKPELTKLILDAMKRCETGAKRLKGLLPKEVTVAHKTGSDFLATNDVGIITLPKNKGHIAIAVFVKNSDKPMPEQEKAIASVARSVYSFFVSQN
jgi:beta-lactamase class A